MALVMGAAACSGKGVAPETSIEKAEAAFAAGHYTTAQQLADSMMVSDNFPTMAATDLCRLSLLYVRLDEMSDVNGNVAMAAQALDEAALRDSDSTALFIAALPVDDRARLLLVEGISEGARHALDEADAESTDEETVDSDSSLPL